MSARAWASPRRFFGWAFAGLFLLIVISIAASLIVYALRGPGNGTGFFPFFGFGFGWVFVFLFFLFFWGFRWWGGWGRWGGYGRSYGPYAWDGAKAILRERYARGEIGKDQFEQMMRDLEPRT